MNVKEISKRCIAMCEAEAIAHNYPSEMGLEICVGLSAKFLENWNAEKLFVWGTYVLLKYRPELKQATMLDIQAEHEKLLDLCEAIVDILTRYGSYC